MDLPSGIETRDRVLVEGLANTLYQQYKTEVLTNRTTSIHNSIKKIVQHYSSLQDLNPNQNLLNNWQYTAPTHHSLVNCILQINIAVETQQHFFLMKIKPLLLLYLILARSGSAENHSFCHVWKLLIIRLYIQINLIARYLMVLPWCTS